MGHGARGMGRVEGRREEGFELLQWAGGGGRGAPCQVDAVQCHEGGGCAGGPTGCLARHATPGHARPGHAISNTHSVSTPVLGACLVRPPARLLQDDGNTHSVSRPHACCLPAASAHTAAAAVPCPPPPPPTFPSGHPWPTCVLSQGICSTATAVGRWSGLGSSIALMQSLAGCGWVGWLRQLGSWPGWSAVDS